MANEDTEMNEGCVHLAEIHEVNPSADGCEDCLRIGDPWVHLRLCEICGHVGCCDNSKNKHATRHFHATRHSIIKSFEPGEDSSTGISPCSAFCFSTRSSPALPVTSRERKIFRPVLSVLSSI